MANTKMTKRQLFEELLALNEVKANEIYVKALKHEIELLDNRKNSEKPTKTQELNTELKKIILANMEENTSYTIAEISKFEELPPEHSSSQKISALVTQLKNAEKIKREEIKGKAYFTKVSD